MSKKPLSFGRYYKFEHEIKALSWQFEAARKLKECDPLKPLLAYGKGRSYGDSCLNEDGILIDTSYLNKVISFDKENGIINCEAGVTIGQIIDLVSPYGWFVPVSPGTKHVTIAGATANDVHGKNHHVRGSFGNNILSLKLLRSDESISILKPEDKMFEATVGGLGLTGLILEVELKLIKASSWFETENIKFNNLDEFFKISDESERDFEYTVAWIDSCAVGEELGKGIFMRGNHATDPSLPLKTPRPLASVPIEFPNFALNQYSVKAFNWLYYNKQLSDTQKAIVHFEPYLYPLDVLSGWNKIYGKRGFHQYQFVVPEDKKDALRDILNVIASSGQGSFLTVLKKFGDVPPVGMLSFPSPGYMIALDFADAGEDTDALFARIDSLVVAAGGRLYPAKDSKMRSEDFKVFYPRLEEFKEYIDPRFSSSFWRRMMLDSKVQTEQQGQNITENNDINDRNEEV